MGLRVAHARGIRRSMDAVMRFAQSDPDDADGIVRARGDARLVVARVGVIELRRVEIEHRILHVARHLPAAGGDQVARLAHADGKLRDDGACGIAHFQDALLRLELDRGDFRRRPGRGHVRHEDVVARFERLAAIERAQQLLAHVEALGERFHDRFIAEVIEPRALHHVARHLHERPLDVLPGHAVRREHMVIGSAQRLPRRRVDAAAFRQPVRGLERRHGLAHVLAEAAVDLAGREPCAVEEDLRAHDGGAARALREDRRTGVVDRGGIERRRRVVRGRALRRGLDRCRERERRGDEKEARVHASASGHSPSCIEGTSSSELHRGRNHESISATGIPSSSISSIGGSLFLRRCCTWGRCLTGSSLQDLRRI